MTVVLGTGTIPRDVWVGAKLESAKISDLHHSRRKRNMLPRRTQSFLRGIYFLFLSTLPSFPPITAVALDYHTSWYYD